MGDVSSSSRRLFIRVTAIILAGASALWSACPPLDSGQSVKRLSSPGHPACFLVTVSPGEATQLIAEQPSDLEFRIKGNGASILIDAFEFGRETLTIHVPGHFRVEVHPVSSAGAAVTVLMSRKALSLQIAEPWRQAEIWAAKSNHSGDPHDIAASLRLWREIGDVSAIARTYLKQGDAALRSGELIPARGAYEEALKFCQADDDLRCAAEAANNSGYVSQQLGDFDQSLTRLTEAAELWERLDKKILQGKTLSNLGQLYRQVSDYRQAISLYDQAGNILRGRDRLANARVLNNLGLCYQYLAEYDKAQEYFERALTEYGKRPSPRDAIRSRLNLGRNCLLQGKTKIARNILEYALAQAAAQRDRQAMGDTLNNLGQALIESGRLADARTRLDQALKLHRALGDKRLEASDLQYLGNTALALNKPDAARRFLNEAVTIQLNRGLKEDAADSLYSLAELERMDGNLPAARDRAEQALDLMESIRGKVPGAALRASFYARKRRFFDLLVEIAMAGPGPRASQDALLASERGRGRALLDLLTEAPILSPLPDDLLHRRAGIERRIDLLSARLTGTAGDQENGLRRQVDLLVAEDEEVEASVRQPIANQNVSQPLGSIDELRRCLPDNSALLEYHLGPRRSYLWLVQSSGVEVFPLPARAVIENQVTRAIEPFGLILERRRSPEKQAGFERAMRILSGALLGNLRNVSLPVRLIIVPDGALNRVPFAALPFPSARLRLGLIHDLLQVPAAAYLLAGNKPRKISQFPRAFLGVSDPVYSARDPRVNAKTKAGVGAFSELNLPRLPFSAELNTVAALVPASHRRMLRGFDATPAMLQRAHLEDYSIIHLSAHALIDDRIPELSRIALTMVDRSGRPVDGFLRSYHLAEFHLNGSTVVLSACDTALGKEILGEGLAGLTTSLFHAGAAQLLLTLSEVDAEGSSEFLSDVYRRIFSSPPASMEHALTLARRDMSRSARWSDPYYWSSFVLYGRPTAYN